MNSYQEIIIQTVVESLQNDFLTKEQMINRINEALDNDPIILEQERNYINRLMDLLYSGIDMGGGTVS